MADLGEVLERCESLLAGGAARTAPGLPSRPWGRPQVRQPSSQKSLEEGASPSGREPPAART